MLLIQAEARPAADQGARTPGSDREDRGASALDGLLAHQETVFLICLGFARNRGDAEELAQETYLRALRGVPELRDGSLLKAWLCSVARNTCLDHLRRRRLRRFVGLSEAPEPRAAATPETLLQERERHGALKRAVGAMPGKLRDVLVLREYGGLGYQEIASALDLEMGTVMSRLHRARAWLARRLSGEGTK